MTDDDWGEAAWTARDLQPRARPGWQQWLLDLAAGAVIGTVLGSAVYYVAVRDAHQAPPVPVRPALTTGAGERVAGSRTAPNPTVGVNPVTRSRRERPAAICDEPVPAEALYEAFPLCP